jgi:flagellar basal-body rod modification protein FlgD
VSVNPTTAAAANIPPATSPGIADRAQRTLGQDAFLKLLITQLKHQDPTKPKDDTEFIAQLAVFSQLEKLTEIAASVKTLTQQLAAYTSGGTDAADQTHPTPPNTGA